MTDTLAELISTTQDTFRKSPAKAQLTYTTQSALTAGFRSDVTIRSHGLVIDEPAGIGGGDAGPSPIEVLLAALGACQEITYKAYATALGIDLKRVSVKLEGDIDLGAFFGVNDAARPGFHHIRGTVDIESNASAEQISALKQAVDAHCPVLDMLSNPVPVDLKLAP